MTNHWIDIQHSDVILIQGSNAAENHPISFKWVLRAQDKGAKVIHVDPRFTRTSARADIHTALRSGTDIAFLNGMMKYIIDNDKYFKEYVLTYTNAAFIVDGKFKFDDGLFSGYDSKSRTYDKSFWKIVKDEKGIPQRDETLKNPRCVFQLLKKHVSRYTIEKVSSITGTPVADLKLVYETFASTGTKDRAGTVMYALGQTHHTVAVQNIRALAMVQLLLGNIGICGGGVNAMRGEPNVQGSTDHALLYHYLPGYLAAPRSSHVDLKTYCDKITPATADPMSVNWWGNTPKYITSLLKGWYGDAATKENDFAYGWLPKADDGVDYSVMTLFDRMYQGKIKGLTCVAQNLACSLPNSNKIRQAMTKLDWMVHVNIFDNETASFWKSPGINPRNVKTEVFLLPATASIEKEGSQANSGRWMQWKYSVGKGPGDTLSTGDIIVRIQKKVQELYRKEGGTFAEPVINMNSDAFDENGMYNAEKVAKQVNGQFTRDVTINGVAYKKGQCVPGFALLQTDGSTTSGNWICSGSFTADGTNLMKRRGKNDPTGLGLYPEWSFAWPMNRRIIYNRASVDKNGQPWNPKKPLLVWQDGKWVGDVADGGAAPMAAKGGVLPFIMKADGVASLFGNGANDGPFPEHYEPRESPFAKNMMSKQLNSPTITLYNGPMDKIANATKEYPIVMTTYSSTEHWCTGGITRWQSWLTEAMPQVYVEISTELAKEKGINNGDQVKVKSARGALNCVAMVTSRFRPFRCDGRTIHQVGMTFNYGWLFPEDAGDTANLLSPTVGDGHSMTPEYKAFMVNVEKA